MLVCLVLSKEITTTIGFEISGYNYQRYGNGNVKQKKKITGFENSIKHSL